MGSMFKGLIAGVLIGVFARKVHSLALGIIFGLAVGAFLAWIIAFMQHGYYFQIMLPGGMVGEEPSPAASTGVSCGASTGTRPDMA